jgi:hypothetical protein
MGYIGLAGSGIEGPSMRMGQDMTTGVIFGLTVVL